MRDPNERELPSVTVGSKRVRRSGREYRYVELRWFDPDGKRKSQALGREGELSDRRIEKARRKKAIELAGTSDRPIEKLSRPRLRGHMARYVVSRRRELRPGTLLLHRQSMRYLRKFFALRQLRDPELTAVTRVQARDFATELSAGRLSRKGLAGDTVAMHVRNVRTLFQMAVDDELLVRNPFDRVAGSAGTAERDWRYVDDADAQRLMEACFGSEWELLFGLCRWAGLRRGEALHLRWTNVDFENRRLTVIASESDDWRPKDAQARKVPMAARLVNLLTQALLRLAGDGEQFVIPRGSIVEQNISRDFAVICRRAKVSVYRKPLHSMRKSCITDWAGRFAMHEVKEWAGHASIATTQKYYLKVSERAYRDAAAMELPSDVVRGVSCVKIASDRVQDGSGTGSR
jgi:integrase